MFKFCRNCQHSNTEDARFCSKCGFVLDSVQFQNDKYLDEIQRLKKEFFEKITVLEQKIISQYQSDNQLNSDEVARLNKESQAKEIIEVNQPTQVESIQDAIVNEVKISDKPEEVSIKTELQEIVTESSSSFLEESLGPIGTLLNQLKGVYFKYKRENKLPVFMLTLAGAIILLFGLGYLLQYSVVNYFGALNPIFKVTIGYVASFVLLAFSLRLYQRKPAFDEYAAALIGLSFSINYLLTYFLHSIDSSSVITTAAVGFVLIVLNTGLSVFIALKTRSKIVAVISFLGGAFAPMYLESSGNPTFYLSFLFLLNLAAHYLSKKLDFKEINLSASLISLAILEAIVLKVGAGPFWKYAMYLTFIHLFSYWVVYVNLIKNKQPKTELDAKSLGLIAAAISLLVFNMYYVSEQFQQSNWGFVLLLSVLIWAVASKLYWHVLNNQLKTFFVSVTSAFAILSVPAILSHELFTVAWAIEGILLVQFGFAFKLQKVRKEGLVLFALSILSIYSHITDFNLSNIFGQASFYQIAFSGFYLAGLWFLLNKQLSILTVVEKEAKKYLEVLFVVWLNAICAIIGSYLLSENYFALSLIPYFLGLAIAVKVQNKFAHFVQFIFLLTPLAGYVHSVYSVANWHFFDQERYAQIAILVLFMSMWLIPLFIQKVASTYPHRSMWIRSLFYLLLPIVYIPSVLRRAEFLTAEIFWFAAIFSSAIQFVHPKKTQKTLSYLLLSVAIISTFYMNNIHAATGAVIGIVVIGLIQLKYQENQLSQLTKDHLSLLVFWYFLIAIGFVTYQFTSQLAFMFSTILLLASVAYNYQKQLIFIPLNSWFSKGLLFLMLFILAALIEPSWSVVLVAAFAYFFMFKYIYFLSNKEDAFRTELMLITNLALFVSYSHLLFSLDHKYWVWLAIFWSIHGLVLLFISIRPQFKTHQYASLVLFGLAGIKLFFYDTKGFETIGRILIFMGIGILLLGGAYLFTQLKEKYNLSSKSVDNELDGDVIE